MDHDRQTVAIEIPRDTPEASRRVRFMVARGPYLIREQLLM